MSCRVNDASISHRLLNNEIEDKSFDALGLPYFADVLSKMADASLLLSYAPVVLEKDPATGAQVGHCVSALTMNQLSIWSGFWIYVTKYGNRTT